MSRASDLWAHYQFYTSDLTEFARKLGFAASAICWLLKLPDGGFPQLVLWALGAVVVYFFLDIVQRLWASIRLKRFLEGQETSYFIQAGRGMPSDHNIEVPRKLDAPIQLVHVTKIVFLLTGFVLIAAEILLRNLS